MRTFMKILGVLVVLGGLGGGLAFWLTSGMADTANTFVAKLRQGDAKAAYELTSPGFRKSTPLKTFEAFVERQGLKSAGEPSWSSRNVKGVGDAAIGTLSGSIKDAKGVSIPARIQLTKSDGKWVVQFFRLSPGGVATKPGEIPPEKDLIKLVHESNLAFTKSVGAKDFSGFHNHISERWRKQANSLEKIQKGFAGFIEKKAFFNNFAKLTPAFDGPAKIIKNGILRVTGYYETRPLRITYRHSYTKEGLSWKLIGFGFHMKPPPAKPAADPSPAKPAQ